MLLRLSGSFRIRRWSKRPKWSQDCWLLVQPLSWVRQNIIKYWGQRTKDFHVRLILVKMAYQLLQIISHQRRGKQHHSCVAQWAGRGSENICDGLCYCLARWHRGPVPRCKYILIRLIITHPTHHNTDCSNYSTLILPPHRTPNTQRAGGWLRQLGDWIFHCPHQCAGAFSSGFSSGEQNGRFTFPTLLKIYGKNKMCDINLSLSSQYEDYFANLEWDHQGDKSIYPSFTSLVFVVHQP